MKSKYIIVCLLAIFMLSVCIRAVGYFSLDGSAKYPFMRNIDSYFFTRYTNLILNGQTYDNLILSPVGGWFANLPLYPTIAAGSYRVVSFFSNMSLEYFMSWFSIIFASLVVIPAYFIGRMLYDRKAGLLSALFITLGSAFIARSLGGDPDSDAIAMLMFISSMAITLVMIKYADKIVTSKNVIIGIAAGIVYGLFAYTWAGYWFPFVIMMGYLFLKFVVQSITFKSIRKGFNDIRGILFSFIVAWFIFAVMVIPLGSNFPLSPITTPLMANVNKADVLMGGMFPNVAVSIAEMQNGGNPLLEANGNFAGILIVLSPLMLTILCFAYLMYAFGKKRERFDTFLFLGVWFILFVFASSIALRFTMFLTPVYGICSAIILSVLIGIAEKKGKLFLAGMLVLVAVIALVYYILPAAAISNTSGPILDDNWWQALNWIKNNTAECSVIATYWDPGHFITGIANRSVIFDGTSQNALYTRPSDMCSNASSLIKEYDDNIVQTGICKDGNLTTARIKDVTIAMLTSDENLSAALLSQYKKCDDLYFLASNDLIGKATWWTYFATWDPRTEDNGFPSRGSIYNYNIFALSSTKYMVQFNMTGLSYDIGQDKSIIVCASNDGVIPCSDTTFALLRVGYQYISLPGQVMAADVQWQNILYIPPELENATFTTLYLRDGYGMNNFELVRNWGELKLFKVKV